MDKILNNKGISLFEILTVIAIIGIMSAIMIPQYAKYKESKSISLARTQIMNDIRTVQNYTMTTFKYTDNTFPKGGYGIHFTAGTGASSYTVFADRGTSPDKSYNSGNESFEEIELPEGIEIDSLKVNGVSKSSVDFVSTPPYGVIYIDGNNKLLGNFITFEIGYTNGVSSDTVTVVSSGAVN